MGSAIKRKVERLIKENERNWRLVRKGLLEADEAEARRVSIYRSAYRLSDSKRLIIQEGW
jgi:hypothetical protein